MFHQYLWTEKQLFQNFSISIRYLQCISRSLTSILIVLKIILVVFSLSCPRVDRQSSDEQFESLPKRLHLAKILFH